MHLEKRHRLNKISIYFFKKLLSITFCIGKIECIFVGLKSNQAPILVVARNQLASEGLRAVSFASAVAEKPQEKQQMEKRKLLRLAFVLLAPKAHISAPLWLDVVGKHFDFRLWGPDKCKFLGCKPADKVIKSRQIHPRTIRDA